MPMRAARRAIGIREMTVSSRILPLPHRLPLTFLHLQLPPKSLQLPHCSHQRLLQRKRQQANQVSLLHVPWNMGHISAPRCLHGAIYMCFCHHSYRQCAIGFISYRNHCFLEMSPGIVQPQVMLVLNRLIKDWSWPRSGWPSLKLIYVHPFVDART